MNPTYSEELIILLNVRNDCQLDEMTPMSSISNELYYIDRDGKRSFAPTWSSTIVGCPVTYEIGRVENNVERPLTL